MMQKQSEDAALPISQHLPPHILSQHQDNENVSWDIESISEIGYAQTSTRKRVMPANNAILQLSS